MPLVLPKTGIRSLLTWMMKSPIVGVPDLVFTLWVNNYTPTANTTLYDLTIASFGGFFEGVMLRSNWSTPVLDGDFAASQWGVSPISYTVTHDPQTIYGWAAYNPDNLELVIVERFDVARTPGVGETLQVVPRMKLGTWVPCP